MNNEVKVHSMINHPQIIIDMDTNRWLIDQVLNGRFVIGFTILRPMALGIQCKKSPYFARDMCNIWSAFGVFLRTKKTQIEAVFMTESR